MSWSNGYHPAKWARSHTPAILLHGNYWLKLVWSGSQGASLHVVIESNNCRIIEFLELEVTSKILSSQHADVGRIANH